MWSKQDLSQWASKTGFLTNWFVKGLYDAGLQKNNEPSLFDLKKSDFWLEPSLGDWSPATIKAEDILRASENGENWDWQSCVSEVYPDLKLSVSSRNFLDWQKSLKGLNTHSWSNLYYVASILEVQKDLDVVLKFCGWDGCRLWLNGKNLFDEHSYHKVIYDKESCNLHLKAGKNVLLFQLDRDGVVARIDAPQNVLKEISQISDTRIAERRNLVGSFNQFQSFAQSVKVENECRNVSKEEREDYVTTLRRHLKCCLGRSATVFSKPAFSYEKVGRVDCGDYWNDTYTLKDANGYESPCHHLKPKKSNGRTILALHGHVKDYKYLLGENIPQEGPRMYVGEFSGDYGRRLARAGFECFVYCQTGFGDKNDSASNEDPCNRLHRMASAVGKSLALIHLEEIHMIYEFMLTFSEVDPQKIGVTGLSGGGFLSMLAGAYDDRFKAVAFYCGICRYSDFAYGEGCGMQIVPGWYPFCDTPELLSLIEPRALLMGQGLFDNTFNVLRFEDMANDVEKYYQNQGSQERFQKTIYPLAHEYEIESATQFFLKNL